MNDRDGITLSQMVWGLFAAISAGLLLAWLVGGTAYGTQQFLVQEWLNTSTYRVAYGTSRRVPEGPKGVCVFIEHNPKTGDVPFRAVTYAPDCENYEGYSYAQLGPFKYALTGLPSSVLPDWSLAKELTIQAAHPQGNAEPILLLVVLGAGSMTAFLVRLQAFSSVNLRPYRKVCLGFLAVTLCFLAGVLMQRGNQEEALVAQNGVVEAQERLHRGIIYTEYFVKTKAGPVSLGAAYADLLGNAVQVELTKSASLACIQYTEIRDCQPAAGQSWNATIQRDSSIALLGLAVATFFFVGGFLKYPQVSPNPFSNDSRDHAV